MWHCHQGNILKKDCFVLNTCETNNENYSVQLRAQSTSKSWGDHPHPLFATKIRLSLIEMCQTSKCNISYKIMAKNQEKPIC